MQYSGECVGAQGIGLGQNNIWILDRYSIPNPVDRTPTLYVAYCDLQHICYFHHNIKGCQERWENGPLSTPKLA